MIDESIGKIIGMAMAYGVSALGLFLAYANYRKRTLKADKVMTPKAWGVVAVVVLTIAGGVLVVAELAQPPAEISESTEALAGMDFEEPDARLIDTEEIDTEEAEAELETAPPAPDEERSNWPLVGMLLPAIIFLSATWITAGLYRHFSAQPHPSDQPGSSPGAGPESNK